MNIKTYYLNTERTALMKAYLLGQVESIEWCRRRPAILILPGGGYEFLSEREAEPIAMRYLAEGYNAFVLYYTTNARYPKALENAAYAMYKIRMRADEFGIDKNKIAVWGASSGGHLAGCLATMWNDEALLNTLGCSGEDIRPDAAVLSYPVISGITNPHKGSFNVLLGENAFHLFLVYPSFFSNDQSISMTVLLNCSKSCDRFVNTHEPIADLPPGAGYL